MSSARRPSISARALLAGVLTLGLFAPAKVEAFCRSTTCLGDGCEYDFNGCEQRGIPLSWSGRCVGFSLNERLTRNLPAAQVREVIAESIEAWSGLACEGGEATLSFQQLADTRCTASPFDELGQNLNVISFRDYDFPYQDEGNTLAKTTVTFDVATGEIVDADIEVNSAFNELTIGEERIVYDLRSILTHELGHFIGLAHSAAPEATMNAMYRAGATGPRSLSHDDVQAACAAYPPAREAACDPVPRGGVAQCETSDGDDGGCAIAGALAARWSAGACWLVAVPFVLRWSRQRRTR